LNLIGINPRTFAVALERSHRGTSYDERTGKADFAAEGQRQENQPCRAEEPVAAVDVRCMRIESSEGDRQSSTCPEQPPSDSAVKVEATQEHDLDGRSHNGAAGR